MRSEQPEVVVASDFRTGEHIRVLLFSRDEFSIRIGELFGPVVKARYATREDSGEFLMIWREGTNHPYRVLNECIWEYA